MVVQVALFRRQDQMVLQVVHKLILSLRNVFYLNLRLANFALYFLGPQLLLPLLLRETGTETGRVGTVVC